MGHFQIDDHIAIRNAEEGDVSLIREFIRGLAEYERLLDQVEASEADLRRYLFRDRVAEVVIAEYQEAPQGSQTPAGPPIPAGFALFFHNFSTFLGRPGIYIEDLFVKPEFRGKGLGKALLSFVARIAAERNCGRLEWSCLDWNEPSIAFYQRQGARPLSEWTGFRVTGDALRNLAGSSDKGVR
ncbi:N-acetyltransferase [Spirochaetia bacterium]|nr:N-acetyltransferase [Spirochaetia bacterium]